jgi:hypothetical protein
MSHQDDDRQKADGQAFRAQPSIDFGEDYHYSMAILPFLKKEAVIKNNIITINDCR